MAHQHVALALSGGGHRAALFGLGSLMYLADADKAREIATISSVSGGSLTNGWIGLNADLTTIDADVFESLASSYAKQIVRGGTLWASWLTYVVVGFLVAILTAAVALTFVLGAGWAWIIWPLAILVFGVVAQQRSRVARYCFDKVLFDGQPLSAMHSAVDHVLCAADLQTAEHVYFSSNFVYSWRTGTGSPADLSVATAAQASACLPGAFSPVSLPLARHSFPKQTSYDRFLLTDGGVYDNMGSEWILRLIQGFDGGDQTRTIDEAIVVNASAGLNLRDRSKVRWPAVGEVFALLAAKDILYDQTTAVRRRLLNLRNVLGSNPTGNDIVDAQGLQGVMVQIDRSPYQLPRSFVAGSDAAAARAQDALDQLALSGDAAAWGDIAEASQSVKTTLSTMEPEVAASLLRHAYTLTMVNAHVILNYPLLPVPTMERARRWLA